MKETHGWWDDVAKKTPYNVQTLSPTDPEHCLSLNEAWTEIEKQVSFRAEGGYKYLFELDPYTGKAVMTELL